MTFRIFVLAVLVANLSESNGQSTISPYLQEQIQKSTGTQATKIQVYMSKKVDLLALTQSFNERRLTMDQRSFELITALKQVADESQESILKHVDRWNSNHSQKAEVLKQFYIVNLMVINAPIELINQLDLLSGIETIEAYDRYTFKYQAPVMKNPSNSREAGGHEPGLEAIHAPFMWRLGYTGLGRKLYTVDTGIWHTHPAISRQWQGNYLPQDWCWKGIDSPDPKDKPGSHGTHVTGTVLGLDSQTADTVGVAFNATFIVSDPIVESVSEVKPIPEVFESYEFALNPDGNPATSSDIPDVICNSWGRGDIVDLSICDQPFIISMFQALDVLGVAVEFSAGNEGPAPGTAGLPAYAAFDSLTIFSVGAVDGNNPSFPIADFSSRGPTPCDVSEELKIKPEVCAPGYNVRSSVSLTDYAFYSGTSMAGPHVAGAVLLLKEAFPFLTGRDLLNALYQTADDLGEPGEDNNYGRGIINLESAYNFLLQSHTPVPPNSSTEDMLLESILIPEDICTGSYTARAVLFNAGQTAVSAGFINLRDNGLDKGTVNWDGSLNPGQRDTVNLPAIDFDGGTHELFASLTLSESIVERELINNSRVRKLKVQPLRNLPYAEGFEGTAIPGLDWYIVNPDLSRTWDTTHTRGLDNSNYSARMAFLSYVNQNALDDLISPGIHVPAGTDSLKIRFDLAYRFRNVSLVDTLEVDISTNCGSNWDRIYKKGGLNLATTDTLWTSFRPFKPSHWRTERIDVSSYTTGGGTVLFRFRTKNDGGSNLYIDNIGIYSSEDPTLIQEKFPEWSLFPNPATDQVNFRIAAATAPTNYMLIDLQGRRLNQGIIPAGQIQGILNMQGLESGIYFFVLENQHGRSMKKLVKVAGEN